MPSEIDQCIASIRADPLDKANRLVAADRLEELGDERCAVLRAGKIPLLNIDGMAIEMLKSCNFIPGCWDKKFVRNLDREPKTPRQFIFLWLLCRKYRRQMVDGPVKRHAEEVYAAYTKLVKEPLVIPPDSTRDVEPGTFDAYQEYWRKKRKRQKTNRQVNEAIVQGMPLFE